MAISDKNLYVVWWGNGTGNFEVMFKASNDNGKTFDPEITLTDYTPLTKVPYAQIKEEFAKLPEYVLKIAAAGDNVYVIANGAENVKNITSPSDIFIRTSNDNGKTFGEEINLSNSTGIQSTRAEIAAAGDNVYVSWWDKTDSKDQPMIRVSNDGGKTFGEATILTANSTSSS
jgi:hypothetical protein